MSESLQDAGFEVVEAVSGEQAVLLIRAQPQRFRALVTDFHMPGMLDGADVASCLREHQPGVPVVIASGRPEVFQDYWRTRLGYKLLCKPYGPGELVGLVSRLVAATGAPVSL